MWCVAFDYFIQAAIFIAVGSFIMRLIMLWVFKS